MESDTESPCAPSRLAKWRRCDAEPNSPSAQPCPAETSDDADDGDDTGVYQMSSGKWRGQVHNLLAKTKSGRRKRECTPCFGTKAEAKRALLALKAKLDEAAKQQASLATMSGAALNGFGGGGGGYLFANLPGMAAAAPAPAPPAVVAAKSKAKRKSGDVMPPPGTKRAPEKSPEPTKSEDTAESVTNSILKVQQAIRRLSMSPAPSKMANLAAIDSNSPRMGGTQLKFDSPLSASSVDVDAAIHGSDMEAMRKALRELRRENEDLREKLVTTQREARVAISRVTGDVIARAKIAEQEFSRKF